MTCGHCVSAVTDELMKLPTVSAVDVDLTSGLVSVSSSEPLEPAQVTSAIDEAGYILSEID